MSSGRAPHLLLADLVESFQSSSDSDVLAALDALPPLLDEVDPAWQRDDYWSAAAYPYVAMADVCAMRRLRPAIRMLLDRACFGDPGEIMRGLRHSLEAIVNPDWNALADVCIDAARSPRLGTQLWALEQLAILEDARAPSIFATAAQSGASEIRDAANRGLKRLAAKAG